MIVAEWSHYKFKGDATKCCEEIMSIGEEAKPEQIVEKARNANTELHKCFDWNDSTAAEKWRVYTARQIVCNLVIHHEEEKTEENKVTYRVFEKPSYSQGYKPMTVIVQSKDEYASLLQQAKNDAIAFKNRYSRLKEYDSIVEEFLR